MHTVCACQSRMLNNFGIGYLLLILAHLPVPLLATPCRSLVVHVVGARSAESSRVARWEILARGMPRLRRLSVVFVGPELRWVRLKYK